MYNIMYSYGHVALWSCCASRAEKLSLLTPLYIYTRPASGYHCLQVLMVRGEGMTSSKESAADVFITIITAISQFLHLHSTSCLPLTVDRCAGKT